MKFKPIIKINEHWYSNMVGCQKHTEQKKADTQVYIPYDYIYEFKEKED